MNLNDFVVLPKSKAKSVKLNARNLQELQMETVTLAHESKEMEEKLQQLKESMSKEKEERGHSEGFRWKSGQFGSLNSNAQANSNKKNKENRLQKLSAGKVKIRVLKEELTVPPQPPPAAPAIGFRTTRKNRLKGTHCGQCEVKTAGIMCAECTENYCVGCFTKFHQKGALKLHRMIPIQTDLQTHVSTRDVVSCFQNQYNPSSDSTFTHCNPSPRSKPNPDHTFMSNAFTRRVDWSPEKGTEDAAKPMKVHPDSCQVLAVNHREEIKVGMIEEGTNREDETGSHTFLLRGQFSEEESARSFQEALRQWRGEKSDGEGQPVNQAAMWTPFRPASVSSMATQADLAPGRGDEGREGRVPVRVEFTDNSLTYMDRLLLKKHRRTPVETYHPSLAFGTDFKSPPHTNSEEETANSLTAQEEDFHRYYASLFAVPVTKASTEPQISTPESCLVIEVLDEHHRATDGAYVTEGRKDNKRKVPTVEQVLNKGRAPVLQTALTCSESMEVCSPSPSPTQASRPSSRASAQPPKTAQKLHHSEPHTSQAKRRTSKVPSSKSKPSARPTAETPRTSRTSIKTPSSMSQKPNCSPAVHKSKPDRDSPRLLSSPSLPHSQTEISKSYSHSPVSFSPGVSPLANNSGPMPDDSLSLSPSVSFSLRSTFTVSPSSSTESTLLPKVCQSTQFHNGSDLSLLLEQLQSSQLSTQPISSVKLSKSPVASNLESQRQSQHSLCESPLSDNHLQLPVSSSPNSPPPPQSLEPLPLERSLSGLSLFNESPQDAYSRHRSTARNEDAQVFISSSPISGDHGSTLSHQDTQCIPSHRLNVIRNPPLAPEMEEEEELSIDSGDEMSSDSLGLASHEEDSSDEESQMQRRLTTGTSREEEQDDLQSHAQEQLSNASRVMQRQGAGSGSERFCDQDGHPPIGVDIYSAHKHCDSLHTSQTFTNNSDPRASDGFGPSSSVSAYAEEHLVFKMMEENHTQPAGIQMHSTTHTGEISANELGASEPNDTELGPAFRPLSRATQEIMEICNVDQTGCEDPDLDTDTTAHTIQSLEQELRLMARETAKQDPLCPTTGNSGSQDQHGSSYSTWDTVSEEQRDEEAAALRDRQSVLLLP